MSLSFTPTNPSYYQDAGAPAISYQSIGLNIQNGQFYLDSSNRDFYICTNNSDQNNLVWRKILNVSQLATVAVSGSYNDLISKPTLATVATTGSYTDLINKPTSTYSSPNFSSITAATRLSISQDSYVNYVFPTSMTSLLTAQSLTATLQYADDSGMSTNLITANVDVNGCSGLLNLTLSGRLQVSGRIPAGKYRKVTLSQSGGATVPTTISSSQEVLF